MKKERNDVAEFIQSIAIPNTDEIIDIFRDKKSSGIIAIDSSWIELHDEGEDIWIKEPFNNSTVQLIWPKD